MTYIDRLMADTVSPNFSGGGTKYLVQTAGGAHYLIYVDEQSDVVFVKSTDNGVTCCWHVTEATITEVTNVVLNSTDDQMLAAIGIDTGNQNWYVFYAGKSDGSETVNSSLHVYYKVSTDSGATWGSETQLTQNLRARRSMWTIPRFTGSFMLANQVIPVAAQAISLSIALPSSSAQVVHGRMPGIG
jgi:hypothetical protein